MIQSSFYPTDYSVVATNAEMTKNIGVLDQMGSSFTDAYYLGWIKPENIPAPFHRSIIESRTEGETTVYTFKDMNPNNTNYDCGYLTLSPTGLGYSTSQAFRYLYYDENSSSWTGTRTALSRLPNKLNVMYEGIANFGITFEGYVYNTNDEFVSRYSFSLGFNAENLYKFLKGEGIVEHTITSYQTSIKISASDFDGTSAYITTENGNYKVRLFITGYNFVQERSANQGNPKSGQVGASVMFYTRIPYDDLGDVIMTGNASPSNSGFSYTSAVGYTFADGQVFVGGLIGELRLDELSSLTSPYQTDSYPYITNDRILARRTDSNRIAWLTPLYTIDDLLHAFGLLVRASNYTDTGTNIYYTPIYGYQKTKVYAPYVTEDNEFTATSITGDLENQEFKDKLRPWQYDVNEWESNDYTEDDKPEYEPPEPPGDEPDEGDWGANIQPGSYVTFGTTAFSRFEMLDPAGVSEFLSKLWAAPQTFWEGLSINKQLAANLNDYILSFRAYPVNIVSLDAQPHHTIYIGASSGITLQQNITTPELVNDVPLGSIKIPRQYHNFLDYNPYTSASIYLPFCGTCEINPKFLYDSDLFLFLAVDCTDGSGVWSLFRWGDDGKYFPILTRQCRVGIDIPITGLDSSQMASNIVNATLQTGQHALSAVNKITGAAAQVGATLATGGAIGAETAVNLTTMGGELVLQGLADATNMAMANKEIPFYTSASSGMAAAFSSSVPYITVRRPLVSNPSSFAHTVGNLVNQSHKISTCSGYTVCRNVDTSPISKATANERAQIKKIMESGFYA